MTVNAEKLFSSLLEVSRERDKVIAAIAALEKRHLDDLVKEGFTREEALKIVAAQGCGIRFNL